MMDVVLGVALVLVFLLSCYGWGSVVAWLCPCPLFRLASFSCAAGLAALSVLGGILNALRWANSSAVLTVITGGAVLGLWEWVRSRAWRPFHGWYRALFSEDEPTRTRALQTAVPKVLALAAGLLACLCLMPTVVFNFHDDFYAYLTRVQRMLQTGSLGGNAFDGMGLDSMGSQSFLQGFFVAIGGVPMANGLDAVCCFFVMLWLAAEISAYWRMPWLTALAAVAAIATINPQAVNVSPLYSSAVATMVLMAWGALVARRLGRCQSECHTDVLGALFGAFLVSLKATVAPFAAVFLFVLYGLLFVCVREKFLVLKSAARVVLFAAAFLLPWAFVHAPTVLRATMIANELQAAGVAMSEPSVAAREISGLFSLRPLFYGDTLASYHVVVALCAGTGAVALLMFRSSAKQRADALAVTAAGAAAVTVYAVNAHLIAVETAVRLSIPVLMGCSALSVLQLGRVTRPDQNVGRKVVALATWVLFGIMAAFAPTAAARVERAFLYRTRLAFPIHDRYVDYCKQSLSAVEKARVREIQRKIPEGAAVLVWTATPLHLDFTRNALHVLTDPGLINPALRLPAGAAPETIAQFLAKWDIRHVMFDSEGPGAKSVAYLQYQSKLDATATNLAYRGLSMRRALDALTNRSEFVYADNRTFVLRLPREADR